MLWDSIQTSPLFNVCFKNEDQKNIWFKNIIRMFYQKSPKKIGNVELTEINKNTIVYMLKDMKTMLLPPPEITASNTNTSVEVVPSNDETIGMPYISNYDKNQGREERIKTIESRLVEKQHEMDSFNRPPPPEIDFRMVEKDEPILNIDELLQKHIRERELYQEIPQQLQPPSSIIQEEIPSSIIIQEEIPPQEIPQQFVSEIVSEIVSEQLQPQEEIQSQQFVSEPISPQSQDLSSKLDKLISMIEILTRFITKTDIIEDVVVEDVVVEDVVVEDVVVEDVVVEDVVVEDVVVEDVVVEDVVVEAKKKKKNKNKK
jgi:hypothetical protein